MGSLVLFDSETGEPVTFHSVGKSKSEHNTCSLEMDADAYNSDEEELHQEEDKAKEIVLNVKRVEETCKNKITAQAAEKKQKTKTIQYTRCGMFSPHRMRVNETTQSKRALGDSVGFERIMKKRDEYFKKKYDSSYEAKRLKVKDRNLNDEERKKIQLEVLEMMKERYLKQRNTLVQKEKDREINRQAEMQMESNPIGRALLSKQHDEDRAKYKYEIERVTEDCELGLIAQMCQFNLLR